MPFGCNARGWWGTKHPGWRVRILLNKPIKQLQQVVIQKRDWSSLLLFFFIFIFYLNQNAILYGEKTFFPRQCDRLALACKIIYKPLEWCSRKYQVLIHVRHSSLNLSVCVRRCRPFECVFFFFNLRFCRQLLGIFCFTPAGAFQEAFNGHNYRGIMCIKHFLRSLTYLFCLR